MKILTLQECDVVSGGLLRNSTKTNSLDETDPMMLPRPGQGLPPDEGMSGLLGGITPQNLSGAVAVAQFNSDYAQAQVDVGDMLTFQSSNQCTITAQNGAEIATGELEVLNGIVDQISGAWTLSTEGDWVDGVNEIFTGVGDETAGFIDLTNACPTQPDNVNGSLKNGAPQYAGSGPHVNIA
jgi:hypothetical protein